MLINLTFKTPDVLEDAKEQYVLNKIKSLSEEFKSSYDNNIKYIKEYLEEEFYKLLEMFVRDGEYLDVIIDTDSMVCEVL